MRAADFTYETAELMRKADMGDAEAQYILATHLLREEDFSLRKGLYPHEIERAINYLEKAAVQGYYWGIAALDLGDIYYNGKIVARDYKKAKLWYDTAVLQNHPIASYMLGECAYYGYDEEIDYKKAAELYRQAAYGYVNAFIRLGNMYMRGEYLPYDLKFAKRLYEHVIKEEEKFFERNEHYSDAYKQVKASMEEWERIIKPKKAAAIKETQEQAAFRKKLFLILNKTEHVYVQYDQNTIYTGKYLI